MKYYYNLYVSKTIGSKVTEVIAKLEKEEVQLNKFLIVLAANPTNHLEFFDSLLLQQKIFPKEEFFVVGIAEGYRDAIKLVKNIVDDIYKVTKDTNIRKYIVEKQKEFEVGENN